MTITFLALTGSLIGASLLYSRSVYNLFTVLAAPYFFIVLLNQYVASPHFGFYLISDDTLVMLMEGLVAFFVGSMLFSKNNQGAGQASFDEKAERYNMKALSLFVFACGAICLSQSLLVLARQGVSLDQFEETTSSLSGGILSHLKLVGLSIAPITLWYGVRRRDSVAFLGTMLVFLSVFLSFTKYNIICPVAASVIFVGLSDERLARKSIVALLALPIALFMLNYFVGFYLRNAQTNVNGSFYGNHLWAYMAGSIIYDNYIFTSGVRVGLGAVEKLMTFVFAFPNLFLNKLFGVRLFPHEKQAFLFVSSGLERSNVVDAIGYLYPSYGSTLDVVEFIVVMLFVGLLFSMLVRVMLAHSANRFNTALPFFLSEFVLMSFFGTFYINSGPWEQLVYCAIVPSLFLNQATGAMEKPLASSSVPASRALHTRRGVTSL